MTAETAALEELEKQQPLYRYVADFLTITRFFIAGFILFLAVSTGATALRYALIALYLGWVTDCVDGSIARRSGTEETWVSHIDLYADVSLIFAFFLFIVVTHMFPLSNALGIIAALGLTVCIRPTRAVIKIVVSPFYALPIILSFTLGIWIGLCFVAFIITFFAIRWNHILEETKETLLSVTLPTDGD